MSGQFRIAISVNDLRKGFVMHPERRLLRGHLKQLAMRGNGSPRFEALKGVSFDIRHGESVAVVGRNGAGKSTLLACVAGLAEPDAGSIQLDGRVAALLQLGSGFHGDLTGIENIHLNASILGVKRRRLEELLEEILEFSEIGHFIQEPVRTYSSGMVLRLAFSIAVCVDPDILIIDEVLAVGDRQFHRKCEERIRQIRDAGKTILCVSHATETVRDLCTRAIWMDGGAVKMDGLIDEVLAEYENTGATHPVRLPEGEEPADPVARVAELNRELAALKELVDEHYCFVDYRNRTKLPRSERPALIVPLDYEGVVPVEKDRGLFESIEELLAQARPEMETFCREVRAGEHDLSSIPAAAEDGVSPEWDNPFFTGMDARAAYAVVRELAPARVVEIGSGNSTRFVRRAVTDGGLDTRIVCIDPVPRRSIRGVADEIREESVLETPIDVFRRLERGDVLFFDGSHLSFHGSDVTHFFLRVLPELRPGVLVHVHDIFLPWDYPPHFDERHYNEQYVLAAFLLGNRDWKPLIPVHYLHEYGVLPAGGASFWMVRS